MSKNVQFSDLWAVILGGSSGFGFAAVEQLAAYGMNIAVLYRETSIAEKLLREKFSKIAAVNEITILPYNLNALDASGRESFIKQFIEAADDRRPVVKLLLHSIARGNLKPLAVSDADKKNDANLLSVDDIQYTTYAMSNSLLDWARALLNENLFHYDARVIGLTSEGAHKHWEGYAAVSIAKASLESLAKYMAVEFSPFGIKTNLIQAGITETSSLKKIPGSEQLLQIAKTRNPMGRMTQPDDVAKVIYLLCTDEAYWINGSIIHVDGGEHCS
ncbi:MAG TPA: SDR family oxidoreductase [Mucilaginibacter sp.]|nr:SDR family oxidoreductase [Mucilaginibacter sp.]